RLPTRLRIECYGHRRRSDCALVGIDLTTRKPKPDHKSPFRKAQHCAKNQRSPASTTTPNYDPARSTLFAMRRDSAKLNGATRTHSKQSEVGEERRAYRLYRLLLH